MPASAMDAGDDHEMLSRKTVVEATGGRASVALGKKRAATEPGPPPPSVEVGDQVIIGNERHTGIIRFFGLTQFAVGEWLGLELDEAQGKNDGSVKGQRYFECQQNYGIFVRPTAVVRADLASASPAPRRSRAKTCAGAEEASPGSHSEAGSPSAGAASASIGLGGKAKASQQVAPQTLPQPHPLPQPQPPARPAPSPQAPPQPSGVETHHIDDESDYDSVGGGLAEPQVCRTSLIAQHDADWSAIAGQSRASTSSAASARVAGSASAAPRKARKDLEALAEEPRPPTGSARRRRPSSERHRRLTPTRSTTALLSGDVSAHVAPRGADDEDPARAVAEVIAQVTGGAPLVAKKPLSGEGAGSAERRRVAAQLELAEAVEEHDAGRIKRALMQAKAAGVAQEELEGAHSVLAYEVQQSMLLELEGVRASVQRLSQTVEAAMARAAQAEQRAAYMADRALGPACAQQLHRQLEQQVWQGLEQRVEEAVRGALSRATSGLAEAVGGLRSLRPGDAGAGRRLTTAEPEPEEGARQRQQSRAMARSLVRSSIASACGRLPGMAGAQASAPAAAPSRTMPGEAADELLSAPQPGGVCAQLDPSASSPAQASDDEAKQQIRREREALRASVRYSLGSVMSGAQARLQARLATEAQGLHGLEDEAAACVGDIRELGASMRLAELRAEALEALQSVRSSAALMASEERGARFDLSDDEESDLDEFGGERCDLGGASSGRAAALLRATARPPPGETPREAARRLGAALGESAVKVCVLGGTTMNDGETERVVRRLAQALSLRLPDSAELVTGGLDGVQRCFAEACQGSLGLFHLVPDGSSSGFARGTDIYVAGGSAAKAEAFGLLGHVYLTAEGGPGVAKEARAAFDRGAVVIPLARTGGASAGMFDFPAGALERPPLASEAEWRAISDRGAASPEEAAEAAAAVLERVVARRVAEAQAALPPRCGTGSCVSWGSKRATARSSLRNPSRHVVAKKTVSFCHQPDAGEEERLTNLQQATRQFLARRRSSSGGEAAADGAGASASASASSGRPTWMAAFNRALLRRREAMHPDALEGLDEQGFSTAARDVYSRQVTPAQASALWRGFSEACDASLMRAAVFCDIMEAVEQGDDVACEFADLPAEEYQELGRSGVRWAHDTRQAEAALKMQREIRRRSSSGHRKRFATVYRICAARHGAARCLDEAGFRSAMQQAHPAVRPPHCAALWRAFVEGAGAQEMGEATFLAMCEALAEGPEHAAEFADMSVEEYMDLGAGGRQPEATRDSNEELQRLLDEELGECSGDDGSEHFEGGLR